MPILNQQMPDNVKHTKKKQKIQKKHVHVFPGSGGGGIQSTHSAEGIINADWVPIEAFVKI